MPGAVNAGLTDQRQVGCSLTGCDPSQTLAQLTVPSIERPQGSTLKAPQICTKLRLALGELARGLSRTSFRFERIFLNACFRLGRTGQAFATSRQYLCRTLSRQPASGRGESSFSASDIKRCSTASARTNLDASFAFGRNDQHSTRAVTYQEQNTRRNIGDSTPGEFLFCKINSVSDSGEAQFQDTPPAMRRDEVHTSCSSGLSNHVPTSVYKDISTLRLPTRAPFIFTHSVLRPNHAARCVPDAGGLRIRKDKYLVVMAHGTNANTMDATPATLASFNSSDSGLARTIGSFDWRVLCLI